MTNNARKPDLELLASDANIADADTEIIEPMNAQDLFNFIRQRDYVGLREYLKAKDTIIPEAVKENLTELLESHFRTEPDKKKSREMVLAVQLYIDPSYHYQPPANAP